MSSSSVAPPPAALSGTPSPTPSLSSPTVSTPSQPRPNSIDRSSPSAIPEQCMDIEHAMTQPAQTSNNTDTTTSVGGVAASTLVALSIGSLPLCSSNPRVASLLIASAIIAFVSMASQCVYSQLRQPALARNRTHAARLVVWLLGCGAYAHLVLSILLFLTAMTLALPVSLAVLLWIILFSAALLVAFGMRVSLPVVIAIMTAYVIAVITFVLLNIFLPTYLLVADDT